MNRLGDDWQLFILAMTVVIGGGYALAFAPAVSADVKIVIGGFIGVVLTYFFGQKVATAAVDQTNGRLERAVSRAINTAPPPSQP